VSGISATQGSTVVNGGGTASFSTPQTGLTKGSEVVLGFVGTAPAGYAWTLAAPAGSGAFLSDPSIAAPTFLPDQGSNAWLAVLNTLDSGGNVTGTYMLPLSIPSTVTSTYTGPLALPYVTPAQVDTPTLGQVLFQNLSKSGLLSAKDTSGTTRQIQSIQSGTTSARPATTSLDVGTGYWDTTIGKPIWWNGSVWKDATGSTV
jgi:hypothetical protein